MRTQRPPAGFSNHAVEMNAQVTPEERGSHGPGKPGDQTASPRHSAWSGTERAGASLRRRPPPSCGDCRGLYLSLVWLLRCLHLSISGSTASKPHSCSGWDQPCLLLTPCCGRGCGARCYPAQASVHTSPPQRCLPVTRYNTGSSSARIL